MKLPTYTPQLIEALNEMIPPRAPRPTDSIEAIMYEAGRRSVVEFLLESLKDPD